MRCPALSRLLLVAAFLLPAMPALSADDPCAGFSWDVHHERELFAKPAEPLAGASTSSAAPALSVDRLYALTLLKQAEVHFAAAPGRNFPPEGAYAALVHLTVPETGTWRISLESKAWVDVLADGVAIASGDFTGQPGCSAPHKIVEFVLPAGKTLTLQLSGGAAQSLKLSVTRAPPRAS